MINIKELRIDPKSNKLIIDAQVRELDYYNNVHIKSLSIDTQDTYDMTGPSANALFKQDYVTSEFIDSITTHEQQLYFNRLLESGGEVEIEVLQDYNDKYRVIQNKNKDSFFRLNSLEFETFEDAENFAGINFNKIELPNGIKIVPKANLDYIGRSAFIQYGKSFVLDEAVCPFEIIIPNGLNKGIYNLEYSFTILLDEGEALKVIENSDYNLDIKRHYTLKNIRLELDSKDLLGTKLDNLFFVYIQASGVPSSDTPCGMDNEYTIGVTLDTCPIYNNILKHIKQLNCECSTPKDLIDSFLQFKALQIAVETEHYQEAINYFNKFFLGKQDNNLNCGCNGGYSL